MRLIDADVLLESETEIYERVPVVGTMTSNVEYLDDILDRQPTVDAVPVVRCKDCKYSRKMSYGLGVALMCDIKKNTDIRLSFCVEETHFCGCGERREGE